MERIIFDIDNTLISNINFDIYVKKAFEDVNYNYTDDDFIKIQDALKYYEFEVDSYKKELITDYFKKYVSTELNENFINSFLLELYNAVPEQLEDGVNDTLEYLSKKYRLSVLTNWFKISQYNRLIKMEIDKYFDKIVGGDTWLKPARMAYHSACVDDSPRDCLMIGDSYELDYQGALNAGLKAILLDKDDKHPELIIGKQRIRKLSDLKEIL